MRIFLLLACMFVAPLAIANPLATATHETLEKAGVVAERLPAGKYTYLRIEGPEQFWIATIGAGVAPGRAVTVRSFACTDDFHSRRLDRRFATLHFGTVAPR